jgi:cytoskeleton protein RodZ
MAKGAFGEHLKREREMRGVSLEEISTATRIATRFLRAIENEQWDQLPGGVFNRGFVRAVARYLGLDEENILAEYGLAAGDRQSVPIWTGTPPAVAPDRPWLAWVLAAVAALVLIGGGWFAFRRIAAWRASRHVAAAATAVSPAASVPHALPANASAAGSTDSTPSSSPEPPALDGAAEIASAPAAGEAPQTPTSLDLKVEAGKTTHVTVEADGQRVFEGVLPAGERRTYTAQEKFTVSARDAGALLLELNGQTLAPIGPPGRAGKVTLTRKALKGTSGGAN